MPDRTIRFFLNGREVSRSVAANKHLAEVLREEFRMTGCHLGCEQGYCGACSLRVDGRVIRGCLMLAVQAEGKHVETIEGLSEDGALGALQREFAARNALQCGFCTPGMLITAAELLERNPKPSREEIRAHLSGSYCRCTGYHSIVDAIESAARTAVPRGSPASAPAS